MIDGACIAPPALTFSERVSQLQVWLEDRGGFVSPKVAVSEQAIDAASGTSRGIVAGSAIEAGERLLVVPKALHATYSRAVAEPFPAEVERLLIEAKERCGTCSRHEEACRRLCAVWSDSSQESIEQMVRAAWIIQEWRNASSAWRPWLDVLPTDWASTVLALPEAHLKTAIPGTEALKEALNRRSLWQAAHELLTKESNTYQEQVPSYETILAARLMVLSRDHGLQSAGGEDAVVPFADLLNHEFASTTNWYVEAGGAFVLKADIPIPAGAQLTVSYGDERSSTEMLIHYGFVPADNTAHTVPVTIAMETARRDPLNAAKRAMLVSMDVYRGFTFGFNKGWAASSKPFLFKGSWSSLSQRQKEKELLGEALANVRIGTFSMDDLSAVAEAEDSKHLTSIHAALTTGDEMAVEHAKAVHAFIDLPFESRAAARLEGVASDYLHGLGTNTETQIVEALQNLGDVDSEDPGVCKEGEEQVRVLTTLGSVDLHHVAASASTLLTSERKLYSSIRDAAREVAQHIANGDWPLSSDAMKAIDDGAASGNLVARTVSLWSEVTSTDMRVASGLT